MFKYIESICDERTYKSLWLANILAFPVRGTNGCDCCSGARVWSISIFCAILGFFIGKFT